MDDDELKALLQEAQWIIDNTPRPFPRQKCPCGSGQQYRHCHMAIDERGDPGVELNNDGE